MSTLFPIPRDIRRQDLVATAGQTVFAAAGFQVFDALDVRVRAKPVGAAYWLTLDPDAYSVALGGEAPAYPQVTLAAPRAAGDLVRIEGARVPSRTTDVTFGGVVRSRPLEAELDRMTLTEQEIRRDVSDLDTRMEGVEVAIVDLDGRTDALEEGQADLRARALLLTTGPGEVRFDARGHRITSAGAPQLPDDVTTVDWVRSHTGETAADEAEAAAEVAQRAAGEAGSSADRAEVAAGLVEAVEPALMALAAGYASLSTLVLDTRVRVEDKLGDVIDMARVPGVHGDGIGDDSAKWAEACATGKPVFIPRGMTLLVDGVIVQPVSGQRFFGGGKLLKTQRPDAYQEFFRIGAVEGIRIEDLHLEYTGISDIFAITVAGANGVVVSGCTIKKARSHIWKNSRNVRFEYNKISGGAFYGLATGGDPLSPTANGLVDGLEVVGNDISECLSEGIDINWDTINFLIEGNRLTGNNRTAHEEEIDIGGGVCYNGVVRRNVIDGAGYSKVGINIKQGTYMVTLDDNDIRASTGIYSYADNRGLKITHNRLLGTYDAAAPDTTAHGIFLAHSAGVVLGDYEVYGNRVRLFGGTGIRTDASTADGTISTNFVQSCEVGVHSEGTRTAVDNNTAMDNRREGFIFACPNGKLNRNKSIGNSVSSVGGYDGILIKATATRAEVTDNDNYDTGTITQRGMYFEAADGLIVSRNRSRDNLTYQVNGLHLLTTPTVQSNDWGQTKSVTEHAGDANFTLRLHEVGDVLVLTGVMTANRDVVFSATNLHVGAKRRVVRKYSATGAYTWNIKVGSTVYATLTAAGQWVDMQVDETGTLFKSGYGNI